MELLTKAVMTSTGQCYQAHATNPNPNPNLKPKVWNQALKNGPKGTKDLVEVDGNSGTIKKVNSDGTGTRDTDQQHLANGLEDLKPVGAVLIATGELLHVA